MVEFTPKGPFTGVVNLTYTLTNSTGTSAPLSIVITVEARPDPTADADIRGMADAQDEAARRFADTQVDNFGRRLEQLHNGNAAGGNAIGVTSGAMQQDPCLNGARNVTERDKCMDERVPNGRSAPAGGASSKPGVVAVWTGGAISVGKRDAATGRSELSVETGGISAGADAKVNKAVSVGFGTGFGSEETKVGKDGSRVQAQSWSLVAYASLHPEQGVFVDGLAGMGGLSFDLRRFVADTAGFASATRSGTMTFGSLTAGIERSHGPLSWSVYGRAQSLSATLDAYTEVGPGLYSLAFDKRSLQSLQGTLGGRVAWRLKWRTVCFTPRVRFEFDHEFKNAGSQSLHYADWLDGAQYSLAGDDWSRDRLNLSAGSAIDLENDWLIDLELGTETAPKYGQQTGRVRVQHRF